MKVFKSYWMVLNKNKASMIMYISIFIIVLGCFILPNMGNGEKDEYTSAKCAFAVFDYDQTPESCALVDYMSEIHNLVEISDDQTETIQDELFNRNISCVLRIPEGFGAAFSEGNAEDLIEVVTISGSQASMLFESNLNTFLSYMDAYLIAGYESDAAMEHAASALNQQIEVSLPEGGDITLYGEMYYFFNYLGWILICIAMVGITPVLLVYNKHNLRERIYCSAYPFSRINQELLMGVLLTGVMLCLVLTITAVCMLGGKVFTVKGAWNILNMFVYMTVALALAFLASQLVSNIESLSLIANVVSLGMAFLCGIFVPAEYLGNRVLVIAHFLPAYWYSQAASKIDLGMADGAGVVLSYMGIQLLFALALIVIGIVISRKKRVTV